MKKKITKKQIVKKSPSAKKVAAKKAVKKKVATGKIIPWKKGISKQDTMQALADRIRSLRKEQGFTSYTHFAAKHKMARTLMSRYELGQDIRFISIVRLARAFGMTLSEFFSEGFEG